MYFEAAEMAAAARGSGVSGRRVQVMLLLLDWQVSWDCGRILEKGN